MSKLHTITDVRAQHMAQRCAHAYRFCIFADAYVVGTSQHELAGVALWLPPGTDVTLMKMVKFGFLKCAYDTGMDPSLKWQKIYSVRANASSVSQGLD